ncbi:MAG: hypothetical protein R2818_09730 [Flavobacteriales bacterium]
MRIVSQIHVKLQKTLFMILMIGTSFGVQAQDVVVLKGQVIVPAHLQTPVDLTMDVGDTSCVRVQLYGRGKFLIETADMERYELRFEQEGSVTKSVQVDTRNSKKMVGTSKRVIAFDVQLEPIDTILPMKYAGPVGDITFHQSNGRLVIERDRTKVLTTAKAPLP